MRHFFIKSLNVLIGAFAVTGMVVVVLSSLAAFSGDMAAVNGLPGSDAVAGFAILVVGTLYVFFVTGFLYLGIGIYENTRRTAIAVEKLAATSKAPPAERGMRIEPVLRR